MSFGERGQRGSWNVAVPGVRYQCGGSSGNNFAAGRWAVGLADSLPESYLGRRCGAVKRWRGVKAPPSLQPLTFRLRGCVAAAWDRNVVAPEAKL